MGHVLSSVLRRNAPVIGLAIFLALLFVLRMLIGMQLPLHPDEAYYWMWSRYLDLSYYDQGPGIAWYIRLFTQIFGNTHFALKLAAVAVSIVAAALIYPSARRIGLTPWYSLAATATYSFLPGIWGGALLILHDSLLLACWNAALLLILIVIDRLKAGRSFAAPLLLLALITALGVLTKHTMILLLLAVLVWWILSGRYGSLLKSPAFYAAIVLGGILLTPLLIWNVQHDFAGVEAILFLRSSGAGFAQSPSAGKLLASQFFALSPVVFGGLLVLAFFGLASLARDAGRHKSPRSILQAWRSIPDEVSVVAILTVTVFLFFFIFSFRRLVQGNWLFPAYATSALLLIRGLSALSTRWHDARHALLVHVLVGAFAITALLLDTLTLPFLPDFIAERIPAAASGERRLGGIQQALDEIEKVHQEEAPQASLMATRYQDAAIASFYLPGQPFVPSTNILMKNQYSFWAPPEKRKDYIVFLIEDAGLPSGPDFLGPSLTSLFDSVDHERSGTITLHGHKVKHWKAYVARGFRGFPDDGMAEMVTGALILYFMPSIAPIEKGDGPGLKDSAQLLLNTLTREQKRKGD